VSYKCNISYRVARIAFHIQTSHKFIT
jgi:hypothetical protein